MKTFLEFEKELNEGGAGSGKVVGQDYGVDYEYLPLKPGENGVASSPIKPSRGTKFRTQRKNRIVFTATTPDDELSSIPKPLVDQQWQKDLRKNRTENGFKNIDNYDKMMHMLNKQRLKNKIKVSESEDNNNDFIELNEISTDSLEPPFTVLLKRVSVRLYPGNIKVALYYSSTLKKYFSVPYGKIDSVIQSEQYEQEIISNALKVYSKLSEINKAKFLELIESDSESYNVIKEFMLKHNN